MVPAFHPGMSVIGLKYSKTNTAFPARKAQFSDIPPALTPVQREG